MSRAQVTLCGSCRKFVVSTLPRTPQHPLPPALPTSPLWRYRQSGNNRRAIFSIIVSINTASFSTSSRSPASIAKAARNNPAFNIPKTGQHTTSASATPFEPTLVQATGRLAPLESALQEKNLELAWDLYNQLAENGWLRYSIVRVLLRRGLTLQLFNLILEKGASIPNMPYPLQVAQRMLGYDIAVPEMFSRLIVDCFKTGNMWGLEMTLQSACAISIPFKLELAYLRGQIYDESSVTNDPSYEAASAIEDPQIDLWVLIYCAYNAIRDVNPTTTATSDGPVSFLRELHHALAHMRMLPNEIKIRDVLAANGLGKEFQEESVKAAMALEHTTYFANLRALREDIKTVVSKRDLPALKALYDDGIRTANPPYREHQYNLFILAFASINHFESATRVWNDLLSAGIVPSVYTWNALLRGCGRARDMNLLMTLWQKMVNSGVQPDTFLWTTRVHALFSMGYIREGMESLRTMVFAPPPPPPEKPTITTTSNNGKKGSQASKSNGKQKLSSTTSPPAQVSTKPNLYTINAAIDGLLRNGHIQEANGILEFAKRNLGIMPDVVTYNTLLKGYMATGDIQESFKCLEEMERGEVRPDVFTCTIILNGLYKHAVKVSATDAGARQQQQQQQRFLEEVKRKTTFATDPTLEAAGEPLVDSTLPILQDPTSTVSEAPPTALPNSQQTLFTICTHLLTQMHASGIQANVNFYTVLIDGLLHPTTKNLPAALDVLQHMQSRGIEGNAATYTIFLKHYLSVGDVDAVEETWREMERRNIAPDHIVLEECVKGFARMKVGMGETKGNLGESERGRRVVTSEDVVSGIMTWLKRIRDLNKAITAQHTLSISSPPPPPLIPVTSPSPQGDDAIPPRPQHDMVFRISMRTYKEVLSRLISEDMYDLVEDVLGEVAERVVADGAGARKAWLRQLEGVLKVVLARGVRVPEVLKGGWE